MAKLAASGKMKVSVIISVYKNVKDLYAVLEALKYQTYTDFEIIVSEDGQSDEMKNFLLSYTHPNTLIHAVQADIGWRKNMALNNAVRHANGEYLIFIDGDCVPHHKFIENHVRYAAPDRIVAGKRIKLGEKYSELFRTSLSNLRQLENRIKWKPWEVLSDGAKFYEEGLYISPDGLLGFIPKLRKMRQLKGCNMSFYRQALEKINGFDEDYVRPAIGEDIDLTWRFEGVGFKLFSVRNLAVQYHLYHKENWTNQDENERLMMSKIKEKKYVCDNGLQKLK